MNILVTGANGFIGSAVATALTAAGHTVRRGVRTVRLPTDIAVDFERDTSAAAWLPRLTNIDAVVNTVGLLGGTDARMMAVHRDTPAAIAAACAQLGIAHFVQLSALGVDSGLATLYYRSKLAGEQGVRSALPQAHVLRPSLVFGHGGPASRMFMQLTRLPLLMLPKAGDLPVQPVHVADVSAAVLALLSSNYSTPQTIAVVGAQPMSLAQYLASLAVQLGRRAPYIAPMPLFLARSSAQLMQHLPQLVWTPETLSMLLAGSQADVAPLAACLGRMPVPVSDFVSHGV